MHTGIENSCFWLQKCNSNFLFGCLFFLPSSSSFIYSFFSYLISLARTSGAILNRMSEWKHFLCLNLEEKLSVLPMSLM